MQIGVDVKASAYGGAGEQRYQRQVNTYWRKCRYKHCCILKRQIYSAARSTVCTGVLLSVLLENKVTALADTAHGRLFRGNKTAAAIVIVTALTAAAAIVIGSLGYFAISEIRGLISNYDYYCRMCDAHVLQACERMDGWLGLEIGRMYGMVCNGVDSLKESFDGGRMASAMGTSFAYASAAMKKMLLLAGAFSCL